MSYDDSFGYQSRIPSEGHDIDPKGSAFPYTIDAVRPDIFEVTPTVNLCPGSTSPVFDTRNSPRVFFDDLVDAGVLELLV